MFSRLKFLLCEHEKRTSACWLNTLSIATRGKPARELRPSTRRLSDYLSHTIGPETYANYRMSSTVQCYFARRRVSRSTKAGCHSSHLRQSRNTQLGSLS